MLGVTDPTAVALETPVKLKFEPEPEDTVTVCATVVLETPVSEYETLAATVPTPAVAATPAKLLLTNAVTDPTPEDDDTPVMTVFVPDAAETLPAAPVD